MARPLALDLFCGAGGASMGLYRARFDVVGVDIKRQPRYPAFHDAPHARHFRFVQADALKPPFDLSRFDLIWASPPCQAYSVSAHFERSQGREYPDLVAPIRAMLSQFAGPTIIENVVGAPVRPDLRLDGTLFPELRVVRERWFEIAGFWAMAPSSRRYPGICIRGGFYSVTGHDGSSRLRKAGAPPNSADKWRAAMGIPWMTRDELTQAIPPQYSEYIAKWALRSLPGALAA